MDSKPIAPLLSRRESEVCYFELVLLIEKEVFWFQIAMNDSSCVVQVLNSAKELEKVIAGEAFIKATFLISDFDEGEKITLLNELQNYEKDLGGFAVRFDDYLALAVVLHELDDVWVVHRLNEAYFVL